MSKVIDNIEDIASIDSKATIASPTFTGTPTVNGVAFSGYSGFKNYIINGKKVVNQRGLTSTDNSYNQDRWYKVGNNWFQYIEGDNNLTSGKTYSLTWVGTATASYYVGNATSSTINAQTFTSISNGVSFTLTISAGQNLWIKFASDATGSTFNFVQLEEGSVATPFENRPYGLELSLCQGYCFVSETNPMLGTGVYRTPTVLESCMYKLPVTMRMSPSSILFTPSTSAYVFVNGGAITTSSIGTTTSPNYVSFHLTTSAQTQNIAGWAQLKDNTRFIASTEL